MPDWINTLLHDRQAMDLLITLLTLYPIARILRRLGLKPAYAALALLSVIVPLLGHMLVVFYAVSRPWPAMPPVVKKVRRTA